jgi:flagellar hook-basal body complex protein FliE
MEIDSVKLGAMLKPLEGLSRAAGAAAPATGAADFGQMLTNALKSVDQAQSQSEALASRFEAGEPNVSLEQTMIAMQKANISFQELVQVRNKLVSAYHDVMNMQV